METFAHAVEREDSRDDVVSAAEAYPWSQEKRDEAHGQRAALRKTTLALVGATYTCCNCVVNVNLGVKPHVRVQNLGREAA